MSSGEEEANDNTDEEEGDEEKKAVPKSRGGAGMKRKAPKAGRGKAKGSRRRKR